MKKIKTDVVIIGSGSAGLAAYKEAKKQNKEVKIIEAGKYGTTCARVGCMPSKLLIAASENMNNYKNSKEFGIIVKEPIVDGKLVMNRIKRERDRFVGFVLESINDIPEKDKINGYAKFKDNNTIVIEEKDLEIKSDTIIIATGSRPSYPKVWKEKLGDLLIINDDVFNWDNLPKSIAVFGAGVIGIELGQALQRLNVSVKLFSVGGTVGALTDPKIKNYAEKTFNEEFYFDIESNVKEITKENDQVKIKYINKETNKEEIEYFDYLLAATGRIPNVDNLSLENTSIERDERGVPIANKLTMQTSVKNIFIAGDSSNQIPLLHEATDQGVIAGHNAAIYPNIKIGLRRTPISIVFSSPQIAMVGNTYKELEIKNREKDNLVIGEVSFENQGRSRVMLKNKGYLRIYVDKESGELIGAEMIAPEAEHLAHLLAWSIQNKLTVKEILEMPFYHPVIEEGVRTAFRNVFEKINK